MHFRPPAPEPTRGLVLEVVDALASVPAEDWDRLVPPDDPFLEHVFLEGLERSGSVGPETGWKPRHQLVRRDGVLVGAMPLYLKTHSWGEYIFDWGWARAAMEAGLTYYPKLVSAVPFTPVTGRRLLTHPEADPGPVRQALAVGAREAARRTGASSVHVLFCDAEEKADLEGHGYLGRLSEQFHWHRDPDWTSFDDYLASLRSASRKQVRRERRRAAGHGLALRMWHGEEMGDAEWDAVDRLYRRNVRRYGGLPYLTPDFFAHLRAHAAGRVRVAFAHQGTEPVAMSFFLTRGGALFGRYWGSEATYDALHFELCYYLPIAWGLEHGIDRFEAGAQGEHKLKRGLMPTACHSAHHLRHGGLRRAVGDYLRREAEAVREELDVLGEHGPFRRGTRRQ